MSRSYRKPCFKDCKSAKRAKQDANRKLRRTKIIFDVGQNCNYKKYYPQWDIYDIKFLVIYQKGKNYWNDYIAKLRRK